MSGYYVNLTAWRVRLRRKICRGIAIRLIFTCGIMLSGLMMFCLQTGKHEAHLGVMEMAEAARETRWQPRLIALAQDIATQQQAEDVQRRRARAGRENLRYRELLHFLQQQLPADAWLVRYQAEQQKEETENTVRHVLAVKRYQVIAATHPLLHHSPPGLLPLRLTRLHHHKAARVRQFTLVTDAGDRHAKAAP
ncbi:hypothetical protein L9H26_15180 [Morganella psychrotolerans]|uniref:Uncharacterized protein n=1 Tax=Morganella psychrotolerans TaxID=368603 RepID=A0A5M9R120_9GAMM|nr:hypothetical protein [Morganella psychrotolerans]KAA8714191.1 hypothetical protein F4V73_14090 [Morganella psychrotolerans]OBU03977.1 hypothetical protein AYY16_13115 [Morganella psychrotolerans]